MASPASPCTGVCKLNASGVCVGCGRALAEIAEWPAAGDLRRRAIIEAARDRRRTLRTSEKK